MAVRQKASPWPFAALVAMTAVFFLYGVAFSLVPWWAGVLLMVVWVLLLVAVLRGSATRPRTTVVWPLLAVGIWFATIIGGSRLLGWS